MENDSFCINNYTITVVLSHELPIKAFVYTIAVVLSHAHPINAFVPPSTIDLSIRTNANIQSF